MSSLMRSRVAPALLVLSILAGALVPAHVLATASDPAVVEEGVRARMLFRVAHLEVPDLLNVYAMPDASSRIVGRLAANTTGVEVTGAQVVVESRTWLPVRYGRVRGWAEANYLEANEVVLGSRVIFTMARHAKGLGCWAIGAISYPPSGQHFLIVLDCFEGDNEAFLLRADGGGMRRVTENWDRFSYRNYQWAPDGRSFTYRRINSCCREAPRDAPPAGIVRYDVRTGEKTVSGFHVVNVRRGDALNIRAQPGVGSRIVGTIPPTAPESR